jgi:hypothetical protein
VDKNFIFFIPSSSSFSTLVGLHLLALAVGRWKGGKKGKERRKEEPEFGYESRVRGKEGTGIKRKKK